jgi:vancomycin resistance protein YoaR
MTMPLLRLRILAGVVLALIIVLALYVAVAMRSGSTAAAGTTVGGVVIGGLTVEEAEAAVTEALGPIQRKRLRVTALDQTFVVKPGEAGLALDAAASVAPAYGRTWNPKDLVDRFLGGDSLPAVAAVDEAALAAQVQVISDALDVAPVEPVLVVEDGEPVLTPGVPGRALDVEATSAALVDAVLRPRAPVRAAVIKVEPSVSSEAAASAVEMATEAVSSPITVRAESVLAVLPGDAVGEALSFTVEGDELVPQLDGAVLHRALRKQLKPIEISGRDATFKIRKGVPKVVKSKVGRGVSDDELATAVAAVLDKPAGQRSVTVTVGLREPDLTTEQARELGVTERLDVHPVLPRRLPGAEHRRGGPAHERHAAHARRHLSLNDTIRSAPRNGYGRVRVARAASSTSSWAARLDGRHDSVDRGVLRRHGARPDGGALHLHLPLQAGTRGDRGVGPVRHEVPQHHPERRLHHLVDHQRLDHGVALGHQGVRQDRGRVRQAHEHPAVHHDLRQVEDLPRPGRGRRIHHHRGPGVLQGR